MTTSLRTKELLDRLARLGDHPVARTAIAGVLDVSERFAARKSQINSSPTLTPIGKERARHVVRIKATRSPRAAAAVPELITPNKIGAAD